MMEELEEGVSSINDQPVNHCVVKGSFNKVFMTGEGSRISVNVFEEKKQQQTSNRDSGYDDDTSPMDSAANDQEMSDCDPCEDDAHPVPMEMEEAVTSCIVNGCDNMVIMSGDRSTVKVNTNGSKADDIPEDVEEKDKHGDINANNNNINSNLCPVQEVGSNPLLVLNSENEEKLLDDGIDVGERPVAHIQPLPREKQDDPDILSNSRSRTSNASVLPTSNGFGSENASSAAQEISHNTTRTSRSRPTDESLQATIDPPTVCSKRRMEEEVEENKELLYKKQKVPNPTSSQECAANSCQSYHHMKIEGSNNTAITAGSGSTINYNYFQCKHAQEETNKDDLNIDHIDGEALKKTGMMSFFERISKHMGSISTSTPYKWKRLARELPMVGYEHLEREIKVLEQRQITAEQKAFAVLVKWWKGNSGAMSMKRTLVKALRHIKLPWLASSLEKEIQSLA